MNWPCSILVLLVLVAFGMSLAVPAEDVPETAYDESEALPCECTPVVSIAVRENIAQVATVRPCASRLRLASLRNPGTELDHVTGRADSSSDSLTILDHSFRC